MPTSVVDSTVRGWRAALGSYSSWLAAALLASMFVLGITSLRNASAVFDEVAHIPAGYAYVRYGDYRLNPEHPPIMKDLAGLPPAIPRSEISGSGAILDYRDEWAMVHRSAVSVHHR